MHHDAIHYFTLAMLGVIPCAIIAGISSILIAGRQLADDLSDKVHCTKLKRDFRNAYIAWRRAESEGDYYAYIPHQQATRIADELAIRNV